MPVDARVAEADGLAVLLDVGDDEDLGMVLELELVQDVDLERAEAAAEVDVLLGVICWLRKTRTWWSRWARWMRAKSSSGMGRAMSRPMTSAPTGAGKGRISKDWVRSGTRTWLMCRNVGGDGGLGNELFVECL